MSVYMWNKKSYLSIKCCFLNQNRGNMRNLIPSCLWFGWLIGIHFCVYPTNVTSLSGPNCKQRRWCGVSICSPILINTVMSMFICVSSMFQHGPFPSHFSFRVSISNHWRWEQFHNVNLQEICLRNISSWLQMDHWMPRKVQSYPLVLVGICSLGNCHLFCGFSNFWIHPRYRIYLWIQSYFKPWKG